MQCRAADLVAWFGLMFALGVPYLDRAFARAGAPPVIAMRESSQPAAASEEEDAVVPTEPAHRMAQLRAAALGKKRKNFLGFGEVSDEDKSNSSLDKSKIGF